MEGAVATEWEEHPSLSTGKTSWKRWHLKWGMKECQDFGGRDSRRERRKEVMGTGNVIKSRAEKALTATEHT